MVSSSAPLCFFCGGFRSSLSTLLRFFFFFFFFSLWSPKGTPDAGLPGLVMLPSSIHSLGKLQGNPNRCAMRS